MKVTTNTPELLIVEERPWMIGIFMIFGALMFAGAGIAMLLNGQWTGLIFFGGSGFWMVFFFIFVRRVQAVFNGPAGWLEIRRRSLRGYAKVRHNLAEIERAVQESMSGDNGSTYRVTLIIPDGQSKGRHPLTQHYTGGGGAQRTVMAINSWLDSYTQRT